MKRLLQIACGAGVLGVAVLAGYADKKKVIADDEASRNAVVQLFQSLTAEQKQLALKNFDDKERHVEQFPAVERPGLPFNKLTAAQKVLVDEAVRAMLSAYGASRCLEVARQTPDNRRYLNFFGTPRAGQPFAWRLAQHHLTLIYAEFGTDKVNEFGPILLGGNPVKSLWDDEEKLALELYAALNPDEVKAIQGKGNSSSGAAIGTNGRRIADLADRPKALARKLLQQRLAVFSGDRRKILDDLIQRDGGIDNLRIAFWGDATRSQRDGGKYHWKIGNATIVCDWQTQGKDHIHMTVRGRGKS
jgi:hypothetical protein